jgi:hypothetical protein
MRYKCGHCGRRGHNARTCRALAKGKGDGRAAQGRSGNVRLTPELHEQLLALKHRTKIPIEHQVALALRMYFSIRANRKILDDPANRHRPVAGQAAK